MNFFDKLMAHFAARRLTPARIAVSFGVAVVCDVLQITLMPVAWTFAQSGVDVVAMVLTMFVLGFHPLLLPTFIIEFIPGVDMLPTWTACVSAVVVLRKRAQRGEVPPAVPAREPPKPGEPPIIDV